MKEVSIEIKMSDEAQKKLREIREYIRDALLGIGIFRPLTWYEKPFVTIFNFFSGIGFGLSFLFATLLMAPLGGIWDGVVRGIDAARALVVVDDDDEEAE